MQSSTIHEITTQSENTLGQRATSSRLYSCSIISGPLCSPIVGRLDGLRKDCGGFCQEVERVGSDLNCAGSLCLKVLPLQPVAVSHPDNALQAYCEIL